MNIFEKCVAKLVILYEKRKDFFPFFFRKARKNGCLRLVEAKKRKNV